MVYGNYIKLEPNDIFFLFLELIALDNPKSPILMSHSSFKNIF